MKKRLYISPEIFVDVIEQENLMVPSQNDVDITTAAGDSNEGIDGPGTQNPGTTPPEESKGLGSGGTGLWNFDY